MDKDVLGFFCLDCDYKKYTDDEMSCHAGKLCEDCPQKHFCHREPADCVKSKEVVAWLSDGDIRRLKFQQWRIENAKLHEGLCPKCGEPNISIATPCRCYLTNI